MLPLLLINVLADGGRGGTGVGAPAGSQAQKITLVRHTMLKHMASHGLDVWLVRDGFTDPVPTGPVG